MSVEEPLIQEGTYSPFTVEEQLQLNANLKGQTEERMRVNTEEFLKNVLTNQDGVEYIDVANWVTMYNTRYTEYEGWKDSLASSMENHYDEIYVQRGKYVQDNIGVLIRSVSNSLYDLIIQEQLDDPSEILGVFETDADLEDIGKNAIAALGQTELTSGQLRCRDRMFNYILTRTGLSVL